jgi:high-affinity Fe2+/Pb2+ permease
MDEPRKTPDSVLLLAALGALCAAAVAWLIVLLLISDTF